MNLRLVCVGTQKTPPEEMGPFTRKSDARSLRCDYTRAFVAGQAVDVRQEGGRP